MPSTRPVPSTRPAAFQRLPPCTRRPQKRRAPFCFSSEGELVTSWAQLRFLLFGLSMLQKGAERQRGQGWALWWSTESLPMPWATHRPWGAGP